MTIWFASDWHLWHENIIRFCNRPFKDALEMNEKLVQLHNERVKREDHFYNLGDITMRRGDSKRQIEEVATLVKRFNGHGRLIGGNHDHFSAEAYLAMGFEKIMAMQMFDNIRFTHIPVHPLSMGNSIANVHGHIHDTPAPAPVLQVDKAGKVVVKPYINISVEMTGYAPVSLEEIKQLIQKEVERGSEDTQVPQA